MWFEVAHIIEKFEEVENHRLFVILFPETKEFFVSKTESETLRPAYRNHYYRRVKATANQFQKVQDGLMTVQMYELECQECTRREAFSHCIA